MARAFEWAHPLLTHSLSLFPQTIHSKILHHHSLGSLHHPYTITHELNSLLSQLQTRLAHSIHRLLVRSQHKVKALVLSLRNDKRNSRGREQSSETNSQEDEARQE